VANDKGGLGGGRKLHSTEENLKEGEKNEGGVEPHGEVDWVRRKEQLLDSGKWKGSKCAVVTLIFLITHRNMKKGEGGRGRGGVGSWEKRKEKKG